MACWEWADDDDRRGGEGIVGAINKVGDDSSSSSANGCIDDESSEAIVAPSRWSAGIPVMTSSSLMDVLGDIVRSVKNPELELCA
jgi:hypothetical protein